MITRTRMRTAKLLAFPLALMLSSSALTAQEDQETAGTIDDSTAFEAMGYAMATQLRLNIGFSEEELNHVFNGMRMAAEGADQPETFQAAVQRAQEIYMGRMQAFQNREMEEAKLIAEENKEEATAFFALLDENTDVQKSASGLYYEILEEGDGENPGPQDRVRVNYRGTLIDGREFDANEGVEFMVNRVVPGFSEGLQLASEGARIKLYIPSDLGYGDQPSRPGSIIEPGDALIFEVELLEVTKVPPPPSGPPPGMPPNMQPPSGPPSGPPPGPPPAPPADLKPPAPPPGAGQ